LIECADDGKFRTRKQLTMAKRKTKMTINQTMATMATMATKAMVAMKAINV
jgi:hypothetical protein